MCSGASGGMVRRRVGPSNTIVHSPPARAAWDATSSTRRCIARGLSRHHPSGRDPMTLLPSTRTSRGGPLLPSVSFTLTSILSRQGRGGGEPPSLRQAQDRLNLPPRGEEAAGWPPRADTCLWRRGSAACRGFRGSRTAAARPSARSSRRGWSRAAGRP